MKFLIYDKFLHFSDRFHFGKKIYTQATRLGNKNARLGSIIVARFLFSVVLAKLCTNGRGAHLRVGRMNNRGWCVGKRIISTVWLKHFSNLSSRSPLDYYHIYLALASCTAHCRFEKSNRNTDTVVASDPQQSIERYSATSVEYLAFDRRRRRPILVLNRSLRLIYIYIYIYVRSIIE